jgi:excisionase family DNA binding protein
MTVSVTDSIEKLLTVEDVMANLRISRPTLYRLLKSGHLISVRIGKRTLFDPTDIRAFIEISKKGGPSRGKTQQRAQEKKPRKTPQPRKSEPKKAAGTPETPQQETPEKPRKTKQPKDKVPDDVDKQGRLL